jgi:hypothetical protein
MVGDMVVSELGCQGLSLKATGMQDCLQACGTRVKTSRKLTTPTTVTMAYQYESNSMKIGGLAPAGATSGLPVFVWLAGTGDYFGTPVDVTRLEAMAARGFISVQVEYPNLISEMNCVAGATGMKSLWELFNEKAAKVVPAALDVVCKHPRANCTAGVAVSGHSQGGFLSLLGLQYANKRVTAAVMPLGVGNPLIPELTNIELSKYLAKEKRLFLTGSLDDNLEFPDAYNGFQNISGYLSEQTTFGPGYMVVPDGTHGFYGENDWAVPASNMKCLYRDSKALWALGSTLDWLAQTASPTKFVEVTDSTGLYSNPCIDQALSDSPEGESLSAPDCNESITITNESISPPAFPSLTPPNGTNGTSGGSSGGSTSSPTASPTPKPTIPAKAKFVVQASITLNGVSVDVFNSHPVYRNAFVKSVAAQCNVSEEFVVITAINAARRRLAGRQLADGVKVEYKVGAETKEAADQAKTRTSAISSTDQAAFVSTFTEKFGVEKAAAEASGDTVATLHVISFTVQDVSVPTVASLSTDADGSGTTVASLSTGALAGIVLAVLFLLISGGMIFNWKSSTGGPLKPEQQQQQSGQGGAASAAANGVGVPAGLGGVNASAVSVRAEGDGAFGPQGGFQPQPLSSSRSLAVSAPDTVGSLAAGDGTPTLTAPLNNIPGPLMPMPLNERPGADADATTHQQQRERIAMAQEPTPVNADLLERIAMAQERAGALSTPVTPMPPPPASRY